jgi:hypothetical protein
MNRILVTCFLIAAFAAPGGSQQTPIAGPQDRREADSVAREALRTFDLLVNEQNFRELGFESPDEVRTAALGEPFQQFVVQLDRLREYQDGQATTDMLTATGVLTYPVLVGENTRSSLVVGRGGEGWSAQSFGAPQYIRMLTEVRGRLSGEDSRPPAEYFEVRVPALNVSFVGSRGETAVVLTPVLDDARFGFVRGESLPAERALSAMVAAARDHNGLPT